MVRTRKTESREVRQSARTCDSEEQRKLFETHKTFSILIFDEDFPFIS